jgi:tRNA threonylcarbamoyladenosine biosynthesis protein TsaB
VLPVSTLATLAQRAHREFSATQVAAAIDARMDEVYWGCYRLEQGEMCLQGLEAVVAPELASLPRLAEGDWFGAGTGWGSYQGRLPVSVSGSAGTLLPHAQDLLQLAAFAWQRGEALDAQEAQPVYLRDNVATPKKFPV